MENTPFQEIFNCFDRIVTDDMYVEWSKEETFADLETLMINGLFRFEFPRVPINNFTLSTDEEQGYFNCKMTYEEIRIISLCAILEWIDRQILDVDVIRQKYSSKDFELTSQANHLSKLENLKKYYSQECFHYQRLYKRRKVNNEGIYIPNYDGLKGKNG